MFEHDLTDLTKMSKQSARERYELWAKESVPMRPILPFEGEKQVIKKLERTFTVSGFGDYRDADGNWRRFVAYRCGLGTISIVHSWTWSEAKKTWLSNVRQQFGSW